VSELYASVLMVGVTISLGSVLVAAALGTIGQAEGATSLGESLQQSASGRELSLTFVTVASSGTCPSYMGADEGTTMTVALFDYGADSFAPVEIIVNATIYPGSYTALSPGTMSQYAVPLEGCAHSTGQTITVVDAQGGEVQVAT
jgi:hypothetical protein